MPGAAPEAHRYPVRGMTPRRRLLLVLLAVPAGCLQSPPRGARGDGAPISGDAAVDVVDASACPVILEDGFDSGRWTPFEQPGSSVTVASGEVRLVADPDGAAPASYAEIRSVASAPIDGSTLTAELAVAETGGAGGVSWNFDPVPEDDSENDLFELVVSGGKLLAIRKQPDGPFAVLCDPCPAYSPVDHAIFRLRSAGGQVFYETSSGSEWSEVAPPVPIGDIDYHAVAYALADSPELFDMTIDSLEWRACAE